MSHTQWFDATPAYGRDYKSQKDVLRDWHGDKDFQIHAGGRSTYTNRADIVNSGGDHQLVVRYARGMKSMVLHGGLKPPKWLQQEQAPAAEPDLGAQIAQRHKRMQDFQQKTTERVARQKARRSPEEEAEDILGGG